MFTHLQLGDWRERWLVGLADVVLAAVGPLVGRRPRRRRSTRQPAILLLRLERVGDLLMVVDAVAEFRAQAPGARIDLVVGSWNEPLARIIPGVDRVESLSVPWLARESRADPVGRLLACAWGWRRREYDLAVNFEGDIRSNVLAGLSGAARRVGFDMAGGGPLLTDRVGFDPAMHTRSNALRLVERAFDLPQGSCETSRADRLAARLRIPDDAVARAASLLAGAPAGAPVVVVHAGGGREIKQWNLDRFAEVANRLSASHAATIVLSGDAGDRALVDEMKSSLRPSVACIDLVGQADLVTLAAVLDRAGLVVTGDTGPMHLAAALDVPVVAVFGPSDPARWGPTSPRARVVRAPIPCSPCNRIRRPPERCRGHVPDCLAAVGPDAVYDAAVSLLNG